MLSAMDVIIYFYGDEEDGPPVATEDKSFLTLSDADAWAQKNYKSFKARGYLIYDKHDSKRVEQWDERRNATWP